jgi:glycosyltransferase involved in cell wall biosynthesis/SAM-dependent methyltransferase
MNFNTVLSQSGYAIDQSSIWVSPGYTGIAYSDGDETETRIAGIIAEAADLSIFSADLVAECSDWPSVYHLASSRANILRPFRGMIEGADVLEIGAGCGAITRYLGECDARVLALEGSPRRAAIARSRTRDLQNVTVVADRFDHFTCSHRFDVVTLIGVLEYAALFTEGDEPMVKMLEQVRGFLKPGGKLIVAIENQLGLKYFAGAAEDHLGIPMYGIEGRYGAKEPQTFGLKELGEILDRGGFANQSFMAPFPDYKLPVSIVTEQGMSCAGFDAGALAWQSSRRDLQLPSRLAFAPELAWPVVAANGLTLDLANSFLVVAGTAGGQLVDPSALAYHYSTWGRLARYCKETLFLRKESDAVELRYYPLAKDAGSESGSSLLRFNIPEKADYVSGRPLSLELLEIVTKNGWKIEEVGTFLRRYLQIVESFANSTAFPLSIKSVETLLPGNCFDLVPQNILITPEGEWRVIDQEWLLDDTIPVGWLLFRSLLQLVNSVTGLFRSESHFPNTRMGFLQAACKSAGFDVSPERIEQYSAREAEILAEVIGKTKSQLFQFQWQPYAPLAHHIPYQANHEKERDLVLRLNKLLLDQVSRIDSLHRVAKAQTREIASLRNEEKKQKNENSRVPGRIQQNAVVRLRRTLDRFRFRKLQECRNLENALREQPLLDPAWYLDQYPDISRSKVDPVRHYYYFGVEEGRNPNPYFDTRWYLGEYPDIAGSGCNPLLHFIRHGVSERRKPNPYFDTRWYLSEYPEVAVSGMNPLLHFIKHGVEEGKNPNPFFYTRWYLDSYPEVAQNGMEPLLHFLIYGVREGKNPNPYFDTKWYLDEYPEVARGGLNPLLHYMRYGVEDGTHPNPYFDTPWYLKEYPQVAASGTHPMLHYLQHWKAGETNPNPYFDTAWYLRNYPDVGKNGMDPLLHFILHGADEKRNPGPHFDSGWYAQQYPDVAETGLNPFLHFIRHGAKEGRDPSPYFDARWYMLEYPDVLESGMHPLLHYLQVGLREGRRPHPDFDSQTYLSDYRKWLRKFHTLEDLDRKIIAGHIPGFQHKPLISVLMPVYNPPLQFLDEAIRSVRYQLYPYWELCIADDASTDPEVRRIIHEHMAIDGRIKAVFRSGNGHISLASNSALELVTGEFVVLLDHDDLLSEDALFWVAEMLQRQPDAGLIYSDEDKIDEKGNRMDPYFKSDWNPFLFLGHNMISHLGVYRTALVREVGGFREGFEGSQDYDLAARIVEKLDPCQIVHIPRVLYHWRILPGSTAVGLGEKPYAQNASERAMNEHLLRTNIPGRVEKNRALGGMHRVFVDLPETPPLVSIIILAHNQEHSVRRCIESIVLKTAYPAYEIILVDCGSDDPAALAYFTDLSKNEKIRLLQDSGPLNFSRLHNTAAKEARGEVLILLNNDTEVLSPDWLAEMVSLALLAKIGAVGAKLLYPDGTVQHGGILMGVAECSAHAHNGIPKEAGGYLGRAQLLQMYTAVSAACLAVRRSVFEEVDGLDEEGLKVGYNDVDLCLKLRKQGYWNVWTPFVQLIQHESFSGGEGDTPEQRHRFWREISLLKKRWPSSFFHDPAYNPNLSVDKPDFSFARRPRLALAARCQPEAFAKSMVAPPAGKPNLLLALNKRGHTKSDRLLLFAESLLRQGMINSYAAADGKEFIHVSAAASAWFDAICLQGEPSGLDWFRQSVMGRLPYLADWDALAWENSHDKGGITEEMQQSLVHAGAVSVSSRDLLRRLDNAVRLDLTSYAHVVPDGFSFPPIPPQIGRPVGIVWLFDGIAGLPDNIFEILGAINEFSQKYTLPVYCQGEFPGEILGKIKSHVYPHFPGGTDPAEFFQARGPLLGIAPVKKDLENDAASAVLSDIRMVEFGGFGIAGVYSASRPYCESDIRTGRVVDNTYENWLAALEELYNGGYTEERKNVQQIREKRSIDRIARECWWPALGNAILKEPVPVSALWTLL